MTEYIKVYPGLLEVDRTSSYHLGFYEILFGDGPLTFELHAHLCGEQGCYCDNIAINWVTQGRVTPTWYTAERVWLDPERQPVVEELASVFRIVEELEKFQERYSHLVFLRRQMILRELGRADQPFEVRVPRELLGPNADPSQQSLGTVRPGSKGGKTYAYALEFCGDEQCYCNHLFLALLDKKHVASYCIDNQNQWSAMDATPEATSLQKRIEPRLKREKQFQDQLAFFRTERTLQNYHRYVTRYLQEHRVGL